MKDYIPSTRSFVPILSGLQDDKGEDYMLDYGLNRNGIAVGDFPLYRIRSFA